MRTISTPSIGVHRPRVVILDKWPAMNACNLKEGLAIGRVFVVHGSQRLNVKVPLRAGLGSKLGDAASQRHRITTRGSSIDKTDCSQRTRYWKEG